MARLQSSGTMSLSDIIFNRTSALPTNNTNYTFSAESNTFASGATVGDQDNYANDGDATDRDLLKASPHSISEFYGANHPNSNFSSVVAKLTDGTDVSSNGYVDGDNARIHFTVDDDDGIGTSFTAGLKLKSDDSVVQSATDTVSGEGAKSINLGTVNDIDAGNDKYYAFVTNASSPFIESKGSDINHYDAIGSVTITDPDASSIPTVAADTTTTNIEHQVSVGDVSSLEDYNWSFAKTSGDGSVGTSTLNETSDASPTITYTGPGVFTVGLRVDGHPSQARNSTTAATVTHTIEYVDSITSPNGSTRQYNNQVDDNIIVKGFPSSDATSYGLVSASATTTFANGDWETDPASPQTSTTDSRYIARTIGVDITPADVQWTQYLQVRAVNGSTSDNGNTFTYYPEIRSNRNVINPQTNTIYSTTNNTDTSAHPTTMTFSSPSTQTDNVNALKYYEYDSKISITSNDAPSTLSATQAALLASTAVGSATVYLAVSGSGTGGSTGQKSVSSATITINYSKEVKSTGVTEHATSGWAAQMTLTYILQGFTATQIEGEIYDTDDLNNKVGSTAILQTGVSLGAAQSISGTQTVNINPSTTFSVSSPATADGEDGFKIKLIGKDSGGTIRATGFTDAFALLPTTSTAINCQLLLGAKFGYNSLLNAADRNQESGNADSTVTVHHIGAIVDSSVLYTSATLATAYDGDLNNNNTQHFFSNGSHAFIVNDSGVVSSKTSRTPSTPASIAVTSGSLTDDTWDIAVTGNTTVARTVRIYYGTSQGATTTATTQAAASQGTSVTTTKSGLDVSGAAGTTIYFSARFENDDNNGSQLSPSTSYAVPGIASFASWGGGPSNLSTTGNVGAGATDETTSGNSHTIAITNNTGGTITISGEFVSAEPSAADGELHYEMAIGSAPTAGSYNRNTVTIANGATSTVYVRFELEQIKPDATTSGNTSFRVVSSGGYGNSANIAISWNFSDGG